MLDLLEKMRLNALLLVLLLSVSLGPLSTTSGAPSMEKEYSDVEGGEFIEFTF